MKLRNHHYLILFLYLFVSGCNPEYQNIEITGKAQKGPFAVGSNVTIAELDQNLDPTGKVYFSTIMDSEGSFDIPGVDFSSDYIQLKVEGVYFHEQAGGTNITPLTLFSVAKISQINNFNINIFTHLEMDRLIGHFKDGFSFDDAKKEAQREILSIFSLEDITVNSSEILDISQQGESNAVLLAISSIVQGYNSGAKLTTFLTELRSDIKDNGLLDSSSLQEQLKTQSMLARTSEIRENLSAYYSELNIAAEIPDFEKYIDSFNIKSSFSSTVEHSLPNSTSNGINLLSIDEDTIFLSSSESYSLAINTTENTNARFYINLLKEDGDGMWVINNNENWEIESGYEEVPPYCNLWLTNNNDSDLSVSFNGEGRAHFYFAIHSVDNYGDNWTDKTIVWTE